MTPAKHVILDEAFAFAAGRPTLEVPP